MAALGLHPARQMDPKEGTEMGEPESPKPKHPVIAAIAKGGLTLFVCIVIIAAAWGVAAWLIRTKPKPDRRPRPEAAALVETIVLTRSDRRVQIHSTGTVVPAREVALTPQVAGRVVAVADQFLPGGTLDKGETVLQIEKVDYELALNSTQAGLVQSQYEYKLELGRQDVARKEWEMLEGRESATDLERELVLRRPHLAAAEAGVRSAQSAVDMAQLDLDRTRVAAPFNLTIREKLVDLGAQVTPQTVIARIVGTDEYWVEVAIPVGQLRWLTFPRGDGQGSPARLVLRTNGDVRHEWQAGLVRRRPDLESGGRMAQVVVSVSDPLTQNPACPLLIGSFVHVYLDGPILESVFALPRTAVHNGNEVWLVGPDGRLEIKQVDIVFTSEEEAFVADGLTDGGQLVVSQMAAPVPGMLLQSPNQADGDSDPKSIRGSP